MYPTPIELEADMVVSLDCLYFGSKYGPCHMENVFIINKRGAESTYETPLELLGPRNLWIMLSPEREGNAMKKVGP
jgi:hypothetical protein